MKNIMDDYNISDYLLNKNAFVISYCQAIFRATFSLLCVSTQLELFVCVTHSKSTELKIMPTHFGI